METKAEATKGGVDFGENVYLAAMFLKIVVKFNL